MKTSKLVTLLVCSVTLLAPLALETPVLATGHKGANHKAVSTLPNFELRIWRQHLLGRSGFRVSVGAMEGRDPDAIWREIKSLAEAEAASGSLSFIPPRFTIKLVGSPQLTIKKGSVGNLGFGNDPYGVPFREQVLIESLRRALAEGHLESAAEPTRTTQNKESRAISDKGRVVSDDNEQWQCYLDQAEQLVKQSVVAIETVTNKDQLKVFLQKTEDQIDDLLYNKLFESIEKYAQKNRYNVIYDRGGDTVKPFSVSVSSVPDGAKVWIMTDGVYRMQLFLKLDPSQWPWTEVVQNPADLIGKYRYKASWPDGRRTEENINVTNANPLRVLPQ